MPEYSSKLGNQLGLIGSNPDIHLKLERRQMKDLTIALLIDDFPVTTYRNY